MKFKKKLIFAVILSVCTLVSIALITSTPHNPSHVLQTVQDKNTLHIIFDMNGVLVKNREQGGIKQIFAALLKTKYKKKLYRFLESLEPRLADEVCACDGDGLMIPQIMCNWLKGTISSQEILTKIDAAAHTTDKTTLSIAHRIFEPQRFITTQKWVPETLKLIAELKEQGHKVYILSNWDSESFALMQQKYANIFALFDGVMISGEVGAIKPDNAIYTHLLQKYNIPSTHACFVDDQPVNVAAGNEVGIHSIACPQSKKVLTTSPNITVVRTAINNWITHKEHIV